MSPLQASNRRADDGRLTRQSLVASLAVIGACAVVGTSVLRVLRMRRTLCSRPPLDAPSMMSGSSPNAPERHGATGRHSVRVISDEALAERNDRYAG
jgi:hypothetical protein